MGKNLLLIAIPAFNEAKTISKVINTIPRKILSVGKIKILVIDDGSIDGTSGCIKKRKVLIVRHIINRGLGASIKTAMVFAKKIRADILVTMDADCQHNPKDIKRLIKPILSGKADLVIGSRLMQNSPLMPLSRRLINKIANIITYLISGINSTDSQSGFRAFSKIAIQKINLFTQRMEVSSEIFKELKKNSLKYLEVPIKPIYTSYSLKKGQSLLNAPNIFLKLIIRLGRK